MARKTHSLRRHTPLQTALIFIGSPLYKFISIFLVSLFFSSSLIERIILFFRFNKLNKLVLLVIPLLFMFLGFGLMYINVSDFFSELPDVSTLPTYKNFASTKLYDRDGKLLYKFYDIINRTPITLQEIPLTVKLATIAKEDKNFYLHNGVSYSSLLRVFIDFIKTGNLTGASTITQQLVKNVYLTPERTLGRKLKEMVLALRVEKQFTKDQILELYLNRVSYGGTSYGIQEASASYFGKDAKDLSLAEAAFLASRPQNPSATLSDNKATSSNKNFILLQMYKQSFLTDDEYVNGINTNIVFSPENLFTDAPHFVIFSGGLLQKQLGQSMWTEGYNAYTTIDLRIQKIAEEAAREELQKIARLRVTNAGVLVISVKTGEVLAMVGSKDYNDSKNDGNVNTTLSERPPGSSIKVVNYAYALSHGFTPASVLDDTPVVFVQKGAPAYKPVNYDGRYLGRISLRNALAQSRNIPAVRVLAGYGVEKMIQLGKEMGISTWDTPSRFGLALTLGGGEVTLLDLAQVYLTIANYGKRIPITAFTNISDSKSNILPMCVSFSCESKEVLTPEVSFQLISILSDNVARAPSFGMNSALVVPNHPEVAVKTGTSNSLRDNLTVGFNQDYLVAVWVGNNDNSPMSRIASGVTGASPIWQKIMSKLLESKPSVSWQVPRNIVTTKMCDGKAEWFVTDTQPKLNCNPDKKEQVAFSH